MRKGLDYSSGPPSGDAIKAAGYDFVVRCLPKLGTSKAAALTGDELRDLHSSGVAVALAYEDVNASRALDGRVAGRVDGNWASARAQELGLDRIPIYFAVDFDASDTQLDTVAEYLGGAAEALGSNRIGVYGGYRTVAHCLDAGATRWAWQTAAWSHGRSDDRIQLFQHVGQVKVDGVTCGVNSACAENFGQRPYTDDAEDDVTPDQAQQLAEIHYELTNRFRSRVRDSDDTDTVAGYIRNVDAHGHAMSATLAGLAAAVDTLAGAVASAHGVNPDDLRLAVAQAIRTELSRSQLAAQAP